MKPLTPLLLLTVCAAASAVHADALPQELEAALERYCSLPDQLLPVLETVLDKQSADAAAPQLFALLKEVYDVRDILQRIPSLQGEQLMQVRSQFEQRMRESWGKLFDHIFRLQRAQCYGSLEFNKQFQILCMMLDQ